MNQTSSRLCRVQVFMAIAMGVGLGSWTHRVNGQAAFLRGDVNADGSISLSDALMLRRWLFNDEAEPACLDAADFDDSGSAQISDVIAIFKALYFDSAPPAAPYPDLGEDSTEDEISCNRYDVVEPLETGDRVRVGDIVGSPGEQVEVPIFITNATEVEAIQLVISYDPGIFMPTIDPTSRLLTFSGGYYGDDDRIPEYSFTAMTPVPAEGYLTIGFIPHITKKGLELPPGTDTLVLRFPGTISVDAEPGMKVALEPTNGPDGQGAGPFHMRNELTYQGEGRYVGGIPILEGAILQIVQDQTFFVRGDSNEDGKVDLSDAQRTLGYLFLGADAPGCMDAMDANDDGAINVSDPIATLQFLFLGGSRMAAPYPGAGRDSTSDAIPCEA